MPQQPYRFLAEMGHETEDAIFWRFVADLRPQRHGETALEIDALKEYRAPLSYAQVLREIWLAWEQLHKGEAKGGLSAEKIKVLIRCRKRELGRFSRGDLLAEMWQAWKDRHPVDYQALRKRMEQKGTK